MTSGVMEYQLDHLQSATRIQARSAQSIPKPKTDTNMLNSRSRGTYRMCMYVCTNMCAVCTNVKGIHKLCLRVYMYICISENVALCLRLCACSSRQGAFAPVLGMCPSHPNLRCSAGRLYSRDRPAWNTIVRLRGSRYLLCRNWGSKKKYVVCVGA